MIISDLTERALIARLSTRVPSSAAHVLVGIGDDAAVTVPARGMVDVITTDVLVEDVHFRRAWSTAADIGAKAVAVNISDLASMGAMPRSLLVSLVLPPTLTLDDFDALIDAIAASARAAGAAVIGGNLSRSPGPLMVDVTAMGVARPRRLLRRSGARPGDALLVTGRLGAAAAGLAMLMTGDAPADETARECISAHVRPVARLRTGRVVAANRSASACMDVSDGLADALRQLCGASRCGADIHAARIPVHPGATPEQALGGGEDYELLFAVPRRRRRLFEAAIRQAGEAPITEIGTCTKGADVILVGEGSATPLPDGFSHF